MTASCFDFTCMSLRQFFHAGGDPDMSYLWCVFIEDLSFQILKLQTFTPVAEHFSCAIDLPVRLCKHEVLLCPHAHTLRPLVIVDNVIGRTPNVAVCVFMYVRKWTIFVLICFAKYTLLDNVIAASIVLCGNFFFEKRKSWRVGSRVLRASV